LKRNLDCRIAGLALWLSCWLLGAAVASLRAEDAPGLACLPGAMPQFAATLNGRPLEMHAFGSGSFAIFELSGPGEVVLHAGFDVRWVNVRPLSAGVVGEIGPNHRDIRIAIKDATPTLSKARCARADQKCATLAPECTMRG
jgi:hypothetical protein